MQFSTQIEFNMTLNNIHAIYSANFDEMLLQQSREMYQGKCLDDQYIKSIDSVVKRSLPNLIKRDLDAKVRIFVVVQATVMRFDQFDIIEGMVVSKIIPKTKIGPCDILECSNNYARAHLALSDALPKFAIGDVIPIKIGTSVQKILSGRVSINAYPFVPHRMEKVAHVIPHSSEYDLHQIKNNLILMLEAATKKLSNVSADRKKFFTELLYPYKSKKTAQGKYISLSDLLANFDKHEGSIVMINQEVDLFKQQLRIIEAGEVDDVVIISDNITATALAFPFVKHLNTIHDLSIRYEDDTLFEHHSYLWKLYNDYKFA